MSGRLGLSEGPRPPPSGAAVSSPVSSQAASASCQGPPSVRASAPLAEAVCVFAGISPGPDWSSLSHALPIRRPGSGHKPGRAAAVPGPPP